MSIDILDICTRVSPIMTPEAATIEPPEEVSTMELPEIIPESIPVEASTEEQQEFSDGFNVSEVVERVQNGDQEAFTELYGHYHRLALDTARRILRNVRDAEEAVQEAFITVHQSIDALSHTENFQGWLRIVVNNKSIDILRKRNAKKKREVCDSELWNSNSSKYDPFCGTPYENIVEVEDARILWGAVNSLPPDQRDALIEEYQKNLQVKVSADRHDVPDGTMKRIRHDAKRNLRRILESRGHAGRWSSGA